MPSPRLQDSTQMMVCPSHGYPVTIPTLTVYDAGAGEQWPELLGVLFQASQSTNAGQREGAFRIFATTPGIIEKQHEETVLAAFTKGFKDEDVTVYLHRLYPRARR